LLSFTTARLGIDPSTENFTFYYQTFRSSSIFSLARILIRDALHKISLSFIAMFYDLEEPMKLQEIQDVLHDEGMWHWNKTICRRCWPPAPMTRICHRHLECALK